MYSNTKSLSEPISEFLIRRVKSLTLSGAKIILNPTTATSRDSILENVDLLFGYCEDGGFDLIPELRQSQN